MYTQTMKSSKRYPHVRTYLFKSDPQVGTLTKLPKVGKQPAESRVREEMCHDTDSLVKCTFLCKLLSL